MIIPSIDIRGGRAVQLRQGRDFVLDGGDPLERLAEFAVVGEVAVVDLDAALGQGDNTALIREMVRRAPCRVGGGIRDLASARAWLDAGARRVVLGTAATPELCAALPRERVIAAVDARAREVVVDGWRRSTGRGVLESIAALAPHVGGFLLTQVEHEGGMAGFDLGLVESAIAAAGAARVTAAGGICTAEHVAVLDRLGADAQIGMALYAGHLTLAAAFTAVLKPTADGLWPTVVCDTSGRALGLAWSDARSLQAALSGRRGVYWSRSRARLWTKGETSGATQVLHAVEVDCDRDALRFTVTQGGAGFCHRATRDCFGSRFDFGTLERLVVGRRAQRPDGSGTARLFTEPGLLDAKLREEADELARATDTASVVHEAADLMYLMIAALTRSGADLAAVEAELARRNLQVTRRPMERKP